MTNYQAFLDLLVDKGLLDASYPVEGCFVWKPYGYRFKSNVFDAVIDGYESAGYEPYQFPHLINEEPLAEISAAIQDFSDGVYWLSDDEGNRYDRYLTPTGETAFYQLFRKWISVESDLPLRAYQHGSTFRPRKSPNILLNNHEYMDVVEGHGAFATADEADAEFDRLGDAFERIHERLGIPCLPLHRPTEGNNPVYVDMLSYETHLPSKDRSFNVGLLYNQSQIYSDPLDVSFTHQDGVTEYTHQVTFGVTDRAVAAMLDQHRDETGIRLLPEFAPVQVTVVPIFDGEHNEELIAYVEDLCERLDGVRTEADVADERPGKKLARSQQRGVPLQVGVSASNLESETVRVIERTAIDDPHTDVPASEFVANVSEYLSTVRETIVEEARERFRSRITPVDDLADLADVVETDDIAKIHLCDDDGCLRELNDSFSGEVLGKSREGEGGECIVCGAATEVPSYHAIRISAA
jgi:prolyl-tRNA synthetase